MTPENILRADQPACYTITVQGRLSENWADWFSGFNAHIDDQPGLPITTTLTGQVADQAALYGVISYLRDLGLILLKLEFIESPSNK